METLSGQEFLSVLLIAAFSVPRKVVPDTKEVCNKCLLNEDMIEFPQWNFPNRTCFFFDFI